MVGILYSFCEFSGKQIPWVPEVFFSLGTTELSGEAAKASREVARIKTLAPTDNNLTSLPTPISERIRKRILRFFTNQINPPRSLGLWCIKGNEESTLEMDCSVPLTHRDLGLICLIKKRSETQNPFSD